MASRLGWCLFGLFGLLSGTLHCADGVEVTSSEPPPTWSLNRAVVGDRCETSSCPEGMLCRSLGATRDSPFGSYCTPAKFERCEELFVGCAVCRLACNLDCTTSCHPHSLDGG
jgi:hypothetical protein